MIYFMKNNIVIRRDARIRIRKFSVMKNVRRAGMLRPKNMICAFQMKKGNLCRTYSRISESSCRLYKCILELYRRTFCR